MSLCPLTRPILYQGLLKSPASWARVGRGYLGGLIKLGQKPQAFSSKGFKYDPGFDLPADLKLLELDQAKELAKQFIGLGFLHPPHLDRLLGHPKINLFVWESNLVPPTWIEDLKAKCDLVIVPSSFTHKSLIDSGMPSHQVATVTYGFDGGLEKLSQKPPPKSGETFTFLAVLAPHYRKGVRELLAAYRKAFSSQDSVRLLLKTTYDPGKSKRTFPFEIPSWNKALQAADLTSKNAPRVEIDTDTLTDNEMQALYSKADVYLQPSWGESFGLGTLEAMAQAIPTITTRWSGHLDFVPEGPDLIPVELQEGQNYLYEPTPGALVAIPHIDNLAERMRWHFEHPRSSKEVGVGQREAVKNLTWTHASEKLFKVIEKLLEISDVR